MEGTIFVGRTTLDEVSALLSPVGALLNHSCYPTTCVAYDAEGRQCFIACRAIARETKLHILTSTAACRQESARGAPEIDLRLRLRV